MSKSDIVLQLGDWFLMITKIFFAHSDRCWRRAAQ